MGLRTSAMMIAAVACCAACTSEQSGTPGEYHFGPRPEPETRVELNGVTYDGDRIRLDVFHDEPAQFRLDVELSTDDRPLQTLTIVARLELAPLLEGKDATADIVGDADRAGNAVILVDGSRSIEPRVASLVVNHMKKDSVALKLLGPDGEMRGSGRGNVHGRDCWLGDGFKDERDEQWRAEPCAAVSELFWSEW